jgi:flavin reductase (DIM6/NTAB) family NADH-FMN oxidoreductase RutF
VPGSALLDGAVRYFVVQAVDVYSVGDHTLYVGGVEYCESSDAMDRRQPLHLTETGRQRKSHHRYTDDTTPPQDTPLIGVTIVRPDNMGTQLVSRSHTA